MHVTVCQKSAPGVNRLWLTELAVLLCCCCFFLSVTHPFPLSARLDTRKTKMLLCDSFKTHWSICRFAHWIDLCTFCSAIRTWTDGNSKLPLSAPLQLKRRKYKSFIFESQSSETLLSLQCCLYGSRQIWKHSLCLLQILRLYLLKGYLKKCCCFFKTITTDK